MTRDIVVVGGGPSGAATAILLARRGLDVVVIDRSRFPRAKPCGEFLSPAATPLLEQLGVRPAVERAGARRLDRVRIVAHGVPLELVFPTTGETPPWGFALSRRRLDAILLEGARSAGAEVVEGVRVDAVAFAADGRARGVFARTGDDASLSFEARLVVGAGGRNCPVARELGVQRRSRRRRYDLLAHWSSGGEDGGSSGVRSGKTCELHVAGDGYVAAARIEEEKVNVNCVVPLRALRRTPDPEALYRRTLDAHPALAGWTTGEPLEPVVASDVTPIVAWSSVADGALLVGDSALFLDPFTGQGIYLALRSAFLAAPVIDAALARGRTDADALAAYEEARRAEFVAKRRVSRAIQAVLPRPRLARGVARGLGDEGRLADTLAAVTGDLAPANRAFRLGYLARLTKAAVTG